MSGYLLLPRELLDLYGGTVPTHPERFGLLDFRASWRRSRCHSRPAQVCLLGMDELLIRLGCAETDAGAREENFCRMSAAGCAERPANSTIFPRSRCPLPSKMVEGATGHVSVRHARDLIPLWRIFGEHPEIREIMGRKAYQYGANLT